MSLKNKNISLQERINSTSLLTDDEIAFLKNNIQSNKQLEANVNLAFNEIKKKVNSKVGIVSEIDDDSINRYVTRVILTGLQTGKLPSEVTEEQYDLIGTNSNITSNDKDIIRDEDGYIYSFEPDLDKNKKLYIENVATRFGKENFDYVIDTEFKEFTE